MSCVPPRRCTPHQRGAGCNGLGDRRRSFFGPMLGHLQGAVDLGVDLSLLPGGIVAPAVPAVLTLVGEPAQYLALHHPGASAHGATRRTTTADFLPGASCSFRDVWRWMKHTSSSPTTYMALLVQGPFLV